MRKRFSEEQIIEILRQHQAGAKPVDLCRQHGISEATLYDWRSRYGGMQVSDAKRLRSLAGLRGMPVAGPLVRVRRSSCRNN